MGHLKSSDGRNLDQRLDTHLMPPLKLNESWAGRRLMEALCHLPDLGGSVDMRFQQKQQQEKEQRRLELAGNRKETETDTARSALTTAKTNNIGNGKVRQMFDERRRGAGIDRSNPLKPIAASSKSLSTPTLAQKSKTSKVHTVRSQEEVVSQTTRKRISSKQSYNSRTTRSLLSPEESISERNNNAFTASFNGIDDLDNETMPKGFYGDADGDGYANDTNNNPKKSIHNGRSTLNSAQIKLNPVLTKKSPPIRTTATTPLRKTNSPKSPVSRQSNSSMQTMKSTISPLTNVSNKTPVGGRSHPPATRKMESPRKPPTPKGPPPEGMVTCKICGRNFNEDRIAKHEEVCQRMSSSKRKVYDASKHRIQGTDVEQFNRKKPTSNRAATQRTSNYISAASATGQTITTKKNNWRQKHEEFITAIRAAKQVQAHLARGGKLSDLPPPPPSENPDYIQCPHCLRRFNETAAERHIPKCATMLHNKPKPPNGANQQKRK